MKYILMNPLSNNKKGEFAVDDVKRILKGEEAEIRDIRKVEIGKEFFSSLKYDDEVIVCGGDGTVSMFTRACQGLDIKQRIYFYPAGSGNDFAHDIHEDTFPEKKLIPLNDLIKDLPKVKVNGLECCFLNGIGFGIDGYCCEVGDELRLASDEPVNYAGIAIKGALGKFKPSNAKVTVDGVTREYKKVWLAPTMIGRYYGGGMKVAPSQDRKNSEKTVTCVVWHGGSRLGTLIRFPSIFTGEHIKHTKFIESFTGHEVTVEFDKPQALQIDGETVKNVTSYSVSYN